MAGTYNEVVADVYAGIDLAAFKPETAEIASLASEVDSAVAFVKAHPAGKAYHDLHARELVDGALAAVIGALFVRFAAKFPEKKPSLAYWIAAKFPAARAQLARAKSGYTGSIDDFEALAPAPVEAD